MKKHALLVAVTIMLTGGIVYGGTLAVQLIKARAAVAASLTPGVSMSTTSTATSGNQKWSPSSHLAGSGWGTSGGAAQEVSGDWVLVPVEGSNAIASMQLHLQDGGGSATERARIFWDPTNTFTVATGSAGTGGVAFQTGVLYLLSSGSAGSITLYMTSGHISPISDQAVSLGTASHRYSFGILGTSSGGQPTCDATTRGATMTIFAASSSSDTFQVCMKAAADTYAWRTVYTAP